MIPPAPGGPVRTPEAWLVAIKDAGPLSDFDRLTLHQAVTIVALELLRARVAGDTERRLAGDVLAAIVSGELTGAELARRLEPFGLSDRVAAIVLGAPATGAGRPGPVEDALWAALREEAAPALVASVGSLACALVAAGPRTSCSRWRSGSRRWPGAELADVRVGIGRAVPAATRGGASTRRGARSRRSRSGSPGPERQRLGARAVGVAARVATYKDLGSFQLLLSLQDDEALRLFCDSILGPIEASEGHYGGELMRSLEAFIEENGSGSAPPGGCTATATPCATGSAGWRS